MLRFDKATYLSFLFESILSERLSNSLSGSDGLLFFELINIVFTFFINLLNGLYCSDVLPDFTCAGATGYFSNICLAVNILRLVPYFALYLASDSKKG